MQNKITSSGKILLTFIMLILPFFFSYAQVTIGTGEEPDKGALLQLKNKDKISDNSANATKGLMMPRVNLSEKDQLFPMFLNDPDNPASGANTDYATNKNLLDKSHTGLIVYNLKEDNDKELCLGLNQWNGKEWNCFEHRKGQAIFTIPDCTNDIKVFGDYGNDVALTSANFITINVEVTKPGTYSITATITDPSDDNGYFFITSGEFLSDGLYSLVIPGMGTPTNYGIDEFTVSINGVRLNGTNPACTFNVDVKDTSIRPKYSMNCSLTQVFGEYYEEKELNATNYIEVTLNVESGSNGASYEIETNEVDGIKFKGNGTLGSSSPQVVKLYGEGVPFDNRDKKFYIKTNSESSTATCVATVYIIIPPKKLLSIGRHTAPGYCLGAAGTVSNNMITDSQNFGPTVNSIVRYAGFSNVDNAAIGSNIIDFNLANQKAGRTIYAREGGYFNGTNGEQRLREYLEGFISGTEMVTPVDIVYIGWTGLEADLSDWVPTTGQMTLLKKYLEKGGIIIVNNECKSFNRPFLRGIFGNNSIDLTTGTANPAGSVYQFENMPSDPVLNGPFGNLASLYWGEDASITVYASNLPVEDIVLYSNNKNHCSSLSTPVVGAATLFRHRTLPLIWSGDGGFSSGNNADPALTYYPFKTGTRTVNGSLHTNYPISKQPYGVATYFPVLNSVFTANALAWCIKTAEEVKRSQRK